MAKKGLFGSKGPLIYATVVSLICVMSASISTFAWFQAEANVQIQTSSSSATITVTKGLDYFLYAYKGNYADKNTDGDVIGYSTPYTITSFSSDFYLIDSDAKQTKALASNGLWPGRRLTFCLAVTGLAKTHVKLDLTRFTSERAAASESRLARYVYTTTQTSILVESAWAFNIYADSATTNSNYSRHLNLKAIADGTTALESQFNKTPGNAIAKDSGKTYTTETIPLVNSTAISSGTSFIFYTLEFSNSSDTFYEEVNGSGTAITVPPDEGSRFFHKNTGGNSNCYEGLSFGINGLSVSEADS